MPALDMRPDLKSHSQKNCGSKQESYSAQPLSEWGQNACLLGSQNVMIAL